jgi:allantoinase
LIAIRSNRTVTPEGIIAAAVIISNGVIIDVLADIPDNFNGSTEDLGDTVLMAGIIDPHVHINEPGRTEWEGFDNCRRDHNAG